MLRNLLFTSLAFLVILSCRNEQKSDLPENAINPSVIDNPVTASDGEKSKDNVPVLKFNKESHDFGTIVQGEKVSFAYTFKNEGSGSLIIRSAQGSCGCTV